MSQPLRLREPETLAERCWIEIIDLVPIEVCSDALSAKVVDVIQKYIDKATSEERGVKTHNLKSWPDAFQAILSGGKRHEYRLNDRDFAKGDELVLQEYDPSDDRYLGRSLRVKVTHADYGPNWDIPEGYCVMSISNPYDIRTNREE
jgi:hypothetical protein